MALTYSAEVPLGSVMPSFKLKDPDGKSYDSDELFGEKGLIVVFTCNHCPYAIAVWPRLIKISRYARDLGINTVAINPNIHPDYPEDAPQKMKEKVIQWSIPFPYLVDDTQEVAKAFGAVCTPDIYLFDKDRRLVYHGRIDDNWQDESKVSRHDLKDAIDKLSNGKEVDKVQYPSMGCSIKWR